MTEGATNVAAVLHAVGDVRIEPVAMPVPGEHEALVELRRVGVCGSDIHYYEHGRIGSFVVEAPLTLGHEAMGVVVAVGAGARRHALGTRVSLEPGVPCGRCSVCRRGAYNVCADVRFLATPPVDGALTRYIALHEDFLFALPDELGDDAGALIEPLSVALWACAKGGVELGSRVLVTGAGPIGNLVVQVARARGAGEIAILDVNAARVERALGAGATRTIETEGSGAGLDGGYDVLIECTGHPDVTRRGIEALRPTARAVLVGMGAHGDATLPVALIQQREIELTGTFRYANTFPTAIALAASGAVDLDGLVDARFPLEDASRALEANRADPTLLKVMVDIGGSEPVSDVA